MSDVSASGVTSKYFSFSYQLQLFLLLLIWKSICTNSQTPKLLIILIDFRPKVWVQTMWLDRIGASSTRWTMHELTAGLQLWHLNYLWKVKIYWWHSNCPLLLRGMNIRSLHNPSISVRINKRSKNALKFASANCFFTAVAPRRQSVLMRRATSRALQTNVFYFTHKCSVTVTLPFIVFSGICQSLKPINDQKFVKNKKLGATFWLSAQLQLMLIIARREQPPLVCDVQSSPCERERRGRKRSADVTAMGN